MAGITMEKRRARAFEAGKEAAKKGFWETANDCVQGTIFYDDWADGWHEGRRELTSKPVEARAGSGPGGGSPAQPKQASGLDNDYWLINIDHPRRIEQPYQVECEDIIEALEMPFAEATVFKSLWRLCQLRLARGKPGSTEKYEAEKMLYYSTRTLEKVKNRESVNRGDT